MSVPSFFNVTPPAQPSPPSNVARKQAAAETKERILAQFDTVFPRIIQMVYAGYTVSSAVNELPSWPGFDIDYGAFHRWIRRDPARRAMLEEAEEARAEVWADRMIQIAEGESSDTIERDKFKNETYKYLMGRQSRRRYGDTKTVEITQTISISAAIEQSKQRVIEAEVVSDYLPDDDDEVRALIAGEDDDE